MLTKPYIIHKYSHLVPFLLNFFYKNSFKMIVETAVAEQIA